MEKTQTDPDWFNVATNYAAATKDALDRRREVLHLLEEPAMWELGSSDLFSDSLSVDDRWQKTCEMRAVALVAARAGDDESFQSAIKMIRMSMNPEHLTCERLSLTSVSGAANVVRAEERLSQQLRQMSEDHGSDSSVLVEAKWREINLRQAIEHKMDDVTDRPRIPLELRIRKHDLPPLLHASICFCASHL